MNGTKKITKIVCWAIAIFLILHFLSFLKVRFMFGTNVVCFAGASLLFPVMGYFLSIPFVSIIVGFGVYSLFPNLFMSLFALSLSKGFFERSFSMYGITFGLPTIAATLCWRLHAVKKDTVFKNVLKFVLEVFVPLFCMAIFIIHPGTQGAWFYSLYWLLPPVLYFIGLFKKQAVCLAFSATFIAHAVGSVLWCYTISMTSAQWLALIPVVAIERFVFTGSQMILIFIKNLGAKYYATYCNDNEWQPSLGSGK
jgi:hypothetical protein